MRILITGVSGFIGNYLAKKWQNSNYEIVGVVRSRKPDNITIPVFISDLSKGFSYDEPVDVIVHAAALSPSPRGSFIEYFENNVIATRNLIRYAEDKGVKKVIFLSSVSVYGNCEVPIVDEDTPIINPDGYGLTKYIAEKLFEGARGFSTIIIRLPGVLGKDATVPWLVKTAQRLIKNETIEIYNPESFFNNMVYVGDVEKFIRHIVDSNCGKIERVLLGSGEPLKVKSIINWLKRFFGSTSEVKSIISDKKSFIISIEKAKRMGYVPLSTEEVLDTFCRDIVGQ
ncbi:NAD-dependent epimerase/dehydratase family protein [Acetivibrio cellulolyticus]|uniref:NAD-dependent epimerase/dehydratase family protein n=1 Tax=Acetivibrio cellulolyticus TaxID=35830 RepID=UPI0001E2FB41|nr:NAD(P)-dependent oxidoreductase [Acetivibrio cellulolyticus]